VKIVCGSDFTQPADAAVAAARAIASRTRGTLRLVHVVEAIESAPTEAGDESLRRRLEAEAARHGGDVAPEVAILRGLPDEVVNADAKHIGADLIVVGALGRRSGPQWRLGSTADRIAQHAPCAVLVVRDAAPFTAWERGERPLRIVAGIDTAPTNALFRWLSRLTAAGPCTLVGAHVYWPPEARERLHLHGPIPIGKGNREVDAAIERDLRAGLASVSGDAPMELRIVGGLGRVADHLVEIAEDENADLVAVGSQQRTGLERLWHGSISRGVIDASPMSVLCVPSR
jgi:nucleotide-binding universal stress UspA family protein